MSETGEEDEGVEAETVEMLRSGLKDIVKEIIVFKAEIKTDLAALKVEIKREFEEEL